MRTNAFQTRLGASFGFSNVVAVCGAALLALTLVAPARADTETRATAPFHAISVEGSWSVDVTVGKDPSVTIEGDKDTIAKVRTDVVNGELRVRLEHSLFLSFFRMGNTGKLSAHITVPTLDAFTRSGSGEATITGLKGGKVTIESNGSGDLVADGQVTELSLELNGSGDANLAKLAAENATVTINGSGDIVVQAHKSLDASINGSGNIKYVGEPARLITAVHGSGSIGRDC
jgi:hypothetical protein